jgi:hypothetical protein
VLIGHCPKLGPFLLDNNFPKVIAERNRFARTMGFIDFYDMKVTQAGCVLRTGTSFDVESPPPPSPSVLLLFC